MQRFVVAFKQHTMRNAANLDIGPRRRDAQFRILRIGFELSVQIRRRTGPQPEQKRPRADRTGARLRGHPRRAPSSRPPVCVEAFEAMPHIAPGAVRIGERRQPPAGAPAVGNPVAYGGGVAAVGLSLEANGIENRNGSCPVCPKRPSCPIVPPVPHRPSGTGCPTSQFAVPPGTERGTAEALRRIWA